MTLSASLLRELVNPNLSVGGRAELCCELAKEFENQGEYEQAREVLGGLWPHIGERPQLAGLEPASTGEVLLRVGVLTGLIGSKNQIAETQETAKDLISESLAVFESLNYQKKIAEAQTELAYCYWRTGEISEARDLLKEALSRLATDSELKAKAVLRLAVVERRAGYHNRALRILTKSASLFQRINSNTLKGCYHQAIADVLENLWASDGPKDYLDRALVEYAAASYHFEQAEHRSYLANVENNLGFLLYKVNHFEEAHEHLDSARHIFTRLKDRNAAAQVDETRARVYLKEKRNTEAEKVARASVRSLEHTDRQSLLAEALITHGIALARLGRDSAALAAFQRAIAVSQLIGALNRAAEASFTAFQEMGQRLTVAEETRPVSGRTLSEELRSVEHDLMKKALEESEGSITYAARSLGMSYQNLDYALKTRHKDLLKKRTPVRRRPRKRSSKAKGGDLKHG
jgi:tetratricopeptide (TPR) repeat protein